MSQKSIPAQRLSEIKKTTNISNLTPKTKQGQQQRYCKGFVPFQMLMFGFFPRKIISKIDNFKLNISV